MYRFLSRVVTNLGRSSTKAAAILFAAFIAISSAGPSFGQDESAEETWTPKKELMKHLQKSVIFDSVSLRPPKGFVRTKHPQAEAYKKAGISIGVWNEGEGKGIPSLVVVMLPSPEKEPWNGEKFVVGLRKSFVRNWKNVKTSKIKKGRLHGATAVQTQYRGLNAEGTEVAGFLVAFNDSKGTVAITCVAGRDGNANAILAIMMNSALTSRRVRKDR